MTVLITTRDGRVYAGLTTAQAVQQMRDAGILTAGSDAADYMASVAARVLALDSVTIRHDTPDNFLADLAANGYLKVSHL